MQASDFEMFLTKIHAAHQGNDEAGRKLKSMSLYHHILKYEHKVDKFLNVVWYVYRLLYT